MSGGDGSLIVHRGGLPWRTPLPGTFLGVNEKKTPRTPKTATQFTARNTIWRMPS
jgi:hypothetical protein